MLLHESGWAGSPILHGYQTEAMTSALLQRTGLPEPALLKHTNINFPIKVFSVEIFFC